ncbi:hypothetical protein EMIT07CA2_550128 [Brevibacillus sp. IT-7CA2]|uniref:hypothetical protein n=1 Tax=Brevibacillus sp. IT-7CA2 TaxID=3026436 RepID=UPI0039DF9940
MGKSSLPDIDFHEKFTQLLEQVPYDLYLACQKLYVDGFGVFGTDGTSKKIIRSLAKHEIPFTRLRISHLQERVTIAE